MSVRFSLLGLLMAAFCGFAVSADEPDKKGPNQSPADQQGKATAESESVKNLHLAYSLVQYGRKHKSPEALVLAAQVLAKTSTEELKAKPTSTVDPSAPKDAPVKKVGPAAAAKTLLAEAKAMSKNDPTVVAMADKVEESRGAVGGPKRTTEVVRALGTDSFTVAFRGGEIARVLISGDGDTRLDLYVYDENGRLVDSRVGPGDDAMCSWVPKWTGDFTIRVVNRGRVSNQYVIVTN